MADKSEKDIATAEKKGVSVLLTKGLRSFVREKLMFEDPVLKAATEFGKRLKAGEETLLSKEESDRELGTIREEQKIMRKNLDDLRRPTP